MPSIRLDQIVFDAGTQIRAAINEQVVSDYAERMTEGDKFPPVVLFHDGNQYYMADGFHRALAAKRIELREIPADVRPGTKTDALWFALGANRTNGQRLTNTDLRHAVLIAVQTFLNSKSQTSIAEQIGCSQGFVSLVISRNNVERPERVSGADGHTYPSSPRAGQSIKEKAAALLREGKSVSQVRTELGVGRNTVYEVKREEGIVGPDKSRDATAKRREQMRSMASEGYTSAQIADAVGLAERTCRQVLAQEGIEVPGDRATNKSKRHDSTRIIESTVLDAENLTAAVGLIDYGELDAERIPEWIKSLEASRSALSALIGRLKKELQKHGQAA